jgi:hypothetical protein
VPARLAARARVFSQGHSRKTDNDDAISIVLAALNGGGVASVRPDDVTCACGCCGRREELEAPAPRRPAACTGCSPSSPTAECAGTPAPARPRSCSAGSGPSKGARDANQKRCRRSAERESG